MRDHGAMLFGDRGGQQVDDAGGAVLTSGRHLDLDLTRSYCDRLVYRSHYILGPAPLRDGPHLAMVSS
jgi:hypothetical protein